MKTVEIELNGYKIQMETGKLAKQAHGAVIMRVGDTMVMATAVAEDKEREGRDFLPLTCDYQEKAWAVGKFPGGFFKREGRPTEIETLVSRMIDRPLRPKFPDGWVRETQIIATVISKDEIHPSDVMAITASSAALHISKVPFDGPLAGVRVGRVDGKLICNPTHQEIEQSDIDIIVAGTKDAIVMVEGGAEFVSESDMVEAIMFGHKSMQPLIQMQEDLREAVGVEKVQFESPVPNPEIFDMVKGACLDKLKENLVIKEKMARYSALSELKKETVEKINADKDEENRIDPSEIAGAYGDLKSREMRRMILDEKRRIDGRKFDEIRPIACEVGYLPRVHGSAIFTRGETQAMVIVTLGTRSEEQKIEGLGDDVWRKFLLHYNFPPFSVGEAKFLRGPGRREIGHGALARRGVNPVLPNWDDFPYTIRIVSDILESNGSSSMATVCGSSLSLMDAGVPVKNPVAGIAMGLIMEGDNYAVLSDILGDEDHMGDMDFKVIGSKEGVTAIQMDIKIGGINEDILSRALEQAREGRLHILGKMAEAITEPRENLSKYAPRIITINIPVEKIKDVIGPGGKIIRSIVEETGAKIDVDDDGRINVASPDEQAAQAAIKRIRALTAELEVGKVYMGRVVKIVDFGAFVEVLPGQEGLVHISQIANERIGAVRDVISENDQFLVRVLDIDRTGRVRLSRKEALGLNPDDVLD